MGEMYDRLKAQGKNMAWYEKGKKRTNARDMAIPLEDEVCSAYLSIYLLKSDGSLWTVKAKGEPYHKVREGKKVLPKNVYICLCCKQQWDRMPEEHPEKPKKVLTTTKEFDTMQESKEIPF